MLTASFNNFLIANNKSYLFATENRGVDWYVKFSKSKCAFVSVHPNFKPSVSPMLTSSTTNQPVTSRYTQEDLVVIMTSSVSWSAHYDHISV